jgi:peptidyl-prolyl cis-trans isomerase B (cyclophilin B)
MKRQNSYTFFKTAGCKRLRVCLILFLTLSISCGDRKLRNYLALNQIFAKIIQMECRGWPDSEKFFTETLLSNPYTEAQQWSALAMGRIAPRQALPLLYRSIRTGDAAVRAASAFAIGEIERRARIEMECSDSNPSVAAELMHLLDDPSLSVRRRVVEALGNNGSAGEATEIARRLEHRSESQPEERAYIESSLVALAKILKENHERFFDLTNHSQFNATAAAVWVQAKEWGSLTADQDPKGCKSSIIDMPAHIAPNRILPDAFSMALAANRKNSTIAIVETNRGTLEIELFREDAPLTVADFVELATEGVYDDIEFAQAPQKPFVEAAMVRTQQGFAHSYGEVNMRPFERGSVGMALAGRRSDNGHFFISLARQPYLDGIQTCFGRVVSGIQVAERIVAGDRIQHISIKETIPFLDYRRY